eukprot:553157-Amphidinium_carterae.1
MTECYRACYSLDGNRLQLSIFKRNAIHYGIAQPYKSVMYVGLCVGAAKNSLGVFFGSNILGRRLRVAKTHLGQTPKPPNFKNIAKKCHNNPKNDKYVNLNHFLNAFSRPGLS